MRAEASCGLAARVDPDRVRQALAALIDNALRHAGAGVRVRVEARAIADSITITVTDNGPGIPPEVSNRVFERFARGDASRTRTADARTGGSTGLGLAIVAAVVEAHHGSVAVASQPGHTRFTVRLPLAQLVPAPYAGPGPDMLRRP